MSEKIEVKQSDRDALISQIVQQLYDARVHAWKIQDKGVLLAAVKLALKEQSNA